MEWYWWVLIILAFILVLDFIRRLIPSVKRVNKTRLSTEELLKLSDEKLINAISERLEFEYSMSIDAKKALDAMPKEKRTAYIYAVFESAENNGGLCQYLSGACGITAPYLSEALKEIGANEAAELFDEFVSQNNIDFDNLQPLNSAHPHELVKEYMERLDEKNYDDFDDKLIELQFEKSLTEVAADYIRANIDAFDME